MGGEIDSFWTIPGRYHHLTPRGEPLPYAGRFRELFDLVWRRIPVEDREELLAVWGSTSDPTKVFLSTRDYFVKAYPARYNSKSREFFFQAEPMNDFPCPEWYEEVIAHELAHAYLFATGHGEHASCPKTPEETAKVEAAREDEVQVLLPKWGIPVSFREQINVWGTATDWGKDKAAVDEWPAHCALDRRGLQGDPAAALDQTPTVPPY